MTTRDSLAPQSLNLVSNLDSGISSYTVGTLTTATSIDTGTVIGKAALIRDMPSKRLP
jgi:hypothetical protein